MSRTVHLEVRAHLDGRNELSVELNETPRGNFVIAVRPKGKRLVYKLLASEVIKWVAKRPPPATLPTLVEGGRVVHLTVAEDVDLDEQTEASITLAEGVRDFRVTIRAKHQRTVYEVALSDVALMVAARHSKFLASQQGISVPRPRRGTGRL